MHAQFFFLTPRVHGTHVVLYVEQAVPIAPTDGKQRQSHYACFRRHVVQRCRVSAFTSCDQLQASTHEECACRAITGENVVDTVPEELKDLWLNACKSGSRQVKTELFQKWLSAGGDWGKCGTHFCHVMSFVLRTAHM